MIYVMAVDSMMVDGRPRFAIMHAFDDQLIRPFDQAPEPVPEESTAGLEPSWVDAYTVGGDA